MKLAAVAADNQWCSNFLEAEALKGIEALEQTQRLLFQGLCGIESKQCRSPPVNCITQTVNCILTTYPGPSLDELMYRCFNVQEDLETVRGACLQRFRRLWLDVHIKSLSLFKRQSTAPKPLCVGQVSTVTMGSHKKNIMQFGSFASRHFK